MSTQQQQPEQNTINEANLHALVGGILHDLGGAFSVPLVQIGESLGLYQTLSENGPLSSGELAARTGLKERYLREWLSAQAASNYITFEPTTEKFSMTPEQSFVFANQGSPFYLAPAFGSAAAFQQNMPQVKDAFRTGEGVAWGDQSRVPVLRGRSLLPSRLRQSSGAVMVASSQRCRGKTRARWRGRRRGMWSRHLHDDHGQGISKI